MLRVQASSSAAPGAAALADVGLPLTSHQRISASARRCGAATDAQQGRDAHTAPALDMLMHKLRDMHASAACAGHAAGVLGSRYTSRPTAANRAARHRGARSFTIGDAMRAYCSLQCPSGASKQRDVC